MRGICAMQPNMADFVHMTRSCKEPFSSNRLALNRNIDKTKKPVVYKTTRRVFVEVQICMQSSYTVNGHFETKFCKGKERTQSTRLREESKLTCLSFFVNCSKIVLKKRTGSSTRHLHTRRRATSITEEEKRFTSMELRLAAATNCLASCVIVHLSYLFSVLIIGQLYLPHDLVFPDNK